MTKILQILLYTFTFLNFSEEAVTLCLFNPDLPVGNFKKLKTEYGKYFSGKGDIYFQPFATKEDFSDFLSSKQNYLAIMPGCQLSALPTCAQLQTLLYGISDKSVDEKFYLITKKNRELHNAKRLHIASALDEKLVGDILRRSELISENVKTSVLTVSKDIDALMSMTFDVFSVDAAIVSEKIYNVYISKNKVYGRNLRAAYSGFTAKKTIVVAADSAPETVHKKSHVLTNLNNDETGRKFMKFLNLDSWEVCNKKVESAGNDDEK